MAAFYDAVLLYAHALRDYIELTPDALTTPLNGTRITELMWNRTITGITGDITMTENGDRVSDYSLLDMDPETGRFVVVANFDHNNGIEYVEGRSIHWSGNRETPPTDQPVCGFDGSLCPDKSECYNVPLRRMLANAFPFQLSMDMLSFHYFWAWQWYSLWSFLRSLSGDIS